MNIASIVIVFASAWFLALFCLLPINIRSQEEAGDDIPEGAMPGAPSNPNVPIKLMGATIIAFLITAGLYVGIASGVIKLGLFEGALTG